MAQNPTGGKKLKWHFLDSNRQTNGPYNTEQLVDMIHSGSLNSRSYIWNGRTIQEWIRIERCIDILKGHGVDPKRILTRQKSRNRMNSAAVRGTEPQTESTAIEALKSGDDTELDKVGTAGSKGAPQAGHHHHHHTHEQRHAKQPVPVTRDGVPSGMPSIDAVQEAGAAAAAAPPTRGAPEPAAELVPIHREDPEPSSAPVESEPEVESRDLIVRHVETPDTEVAQVTQETQKIEYEGVALVIDSCVTYGTVMGEITFDPAKKQCMFDMIFQSVHDDAPEAHQTLLTFDWDTETKSLYEANWEGTCVGPGNAFHIKNKEGIDICMIPSGFEKLPPDVTEFQGQYIGLALGVDQATFWGTYAGNITFNIPTRQITFQLNFESSFPEQIAHHTETLEFMWDPVKGEVDDEIHHFFGRCCGVGNCFHLRNSYEMDIIFLPQIPGDDTEHDDETEHDEKGFEDLPVEKVQQQQQQQPGGEPEPEEPEPAAAIVEQIQQKIEEEVQPEPEPEEEAILEPGDDQSEGMVLLQHRIAEKTETEAELQSELDELREKLADAQDRQNAAEIEKRKELETLNESWSAKASEMREQAIRDAEAQFQEELDVTENWMEQMQELLAKVEKKLEQETQERRDMEEALEQRQRDMRDLRHSVNTLNREKEDMAEELARKNQEIERLINEIESYSRGGTPIRDEPRHQEHFPQVNGLSHRPKPTLSLRSRAPQLPRQDFSRRAGPPNLFGTQTEQHPRTTNSLGTHSSHSNAQYHKGSVDSSTPPDRRAADHSPARSYRSQTPSKLTDPIERNNFIRSMARSIKKKNSSTRVIHE